MIRPFQLVAGTDRLRICGRHVKPVTDELLLCVEHATTGSGRSVLLDRVAAAELHAWLGGWLNQGWPGVPPEHSPKEKP